MKIQCGIIFLALIVLFNQCVEKSNAAISPGLFFAKGADISWLTQMEAAGVKFYNSNGIEQDCLEILKSKGINSVRLRAWVHPTDGWNNTADVVNKAKRAKALGLKIMIDFHYSDSWADPGKQPKPASWTSLSFDQLKTKVHDYTKGVLDTLKMNEITSDWVQIGNETNDGMLWEDGRASTSMSNFASLVKAGASAVRESVPTTKIIVHLSNGYDNNLFRWMFDGLKANNVDFDIVGMSLYPSYAPLGASAWSTTNNQCLTNMRDIVNRYNKSVMIVEVGMPANQPEACNAFLTDIIIKAKSLSDYGLGVFYWEPECYNNWQGYGLGAFDNAGKPTSALDAFSAN